VIATSPLDEASGTGSMGDALRRELHAFISSGEDSERQFDELANRLFQWHLATIPKYRAFCERRAKDLPRPRTHRQIPLLSVEAFKLAELSSTPTRIVRRFVSSGTANGARGVAAFDPGALELMNAAIVANARERLFGDGTRCRFLSLAPRPEAAPQMIMVYGLSVLNEHFGEGEMASMLSERGLDLERLLTAIAAAHENAQPLALVGASFSFVHLFDMLRERSEPLAPLPPGSRILHAGGFKGRSRELTPQAFNQQLSELFGINGRQSVNLLGMTELSSQIYELSGASRSTKVPPPWMRSRVVSPRDPSREVAEGEVGLLAHVDLANYSRPIAILSDDLARRVEAGFELLGRARGTDPRGCSLTVEELGRRS